MDESRRYRRGMKIRRAVLGDAHVDRAETTKNRFNEPFQELISRYAWGESRKEIQEVLLHAAIYCGVPAANSAFHIAEAVFRKEPEK